MHTAHVGVGPSTELVRVCDGDFCGTTYSVGLNGGGAVFRNTSVGVVATLKECTGNDESKRRSMPFAVSDCRNRLKVLTKRRSIPYPPHSK